MKGAERKPEFRRASASPQFQRAVATVFPWGRFSPSLGASARPFESASAEPAQLQKVSRPPNRGGSKHSPRPQLGCIQLPARNNPKSGDGKRGCRAKARRRKGMRIEPNSPDGGIADDRHLLLLCAFARHPVAVFKIIRIPQSECLNAPPTPRALRPLAQGCEARATMGHRVKR